MNQDNERLQEYLQPKGIRWIVAYTLLVVIGYGQYGLAYLIQRTTQTEIFLGVVLTLAAILFASAAYGLQTQKRWAYKLTIALYTLLLIFEVFRLTIQGMSSNISTVDILIQLQAIGFAFWIRTYLKKDKVKSWFNNDELETRNAIPVQEQMEEELRLIREARFKGLLMFSVPILVVTSLWLSSKIAPIPEFNDLKITEGKLIKVTGETRRGGSSYLKLKKDNGDIFSVRGVRANYYKPFVGQRVKIWSSYECALFGYWCTHTVLQAKSLNKYAPYKNKIILDYKTVRKHMEEYKYSVDIFDYLLGGIVLFFLSLSGILLYLSRTKILAIQSKYNLEKAEE